MNSGFTLDVSQFPLKKAVKCSVPQCTGMATHHNTVILPHKYIPVEYEYREIKFMLPKDATCLVCKKDIMNHKDALTHHFKTEIVFQNKNENDKISVVAPENQDLKIVF